VAAATKHTDEDGVALYRRMAPRLHAYVACRVGPGGARTTEAITAAALKPFLRRRRRPRPADAAGSEAEMFAAARRATTSAGPAHLVAATTVEPPPVDGAEPIDRLGPRVLDARDAKRVVAATDSLTEVQREVVLLRFAGGLSVACTARVLDLGADDVRTVQATAIRSLATRFGGDAADHTPASPRAVDDFVADVMAGGGEDEGGVPARVAATVRLLADATRVRFPADLDARIRARVLGPGSAPPDGASTAPPDPRARLRRVVAAVMILVLAAAVVFGVLALRRSSPGTSGPNETATTTPAGPAASQAPNPSSPTTSPSGASTTAAATSTTAPASPEAPQPLSTTPSPNTAPAPQQSSGGASDGTQAPSVTHDTRPYTFSTGP